LSTGGVGPWSPIRLNLNSEVSIPVIGEIPPFEDAIESIREWEAVIDRG